MRKIEIKSFEAFARINEVKAEVQRTNTAKVTKEFQQNLEQLVTVFDQIEALQAQIKHLQSTSKGLEEWITNEMDNKYGATMVKVGKIIVAIKEQRGRVVPSYKGMVDEMSNEIRKLVKDMSVAAGIINEIKDKHTPDAKTSRELHFAVEESVVSWGKKQLADLKAWLKRKFDELTKVFKSADKSADKLMRMLNLSVNESYEMKVDETDDISAEYAKAIIVEALEAHRDEHGSNMAYDIDLEGALIKHFENDREIAQEHSPMVIATLKEICEKLVAAAKKIDPERYGTGPAGLPSGNEEV